MNFLHLLNQPIVQYTLLLYITWIIILITNIFMKDQRSTSPDNSKPILTTLILAYVIGFLFLTNKSLLHIFPIFNSIILGLTTWLILSTNTNDKSTNKLLLLLVLLINLIPYTIVSIYNSYPLGDDVRFTAGFAAAISENGRWVPFKYFENDYYQLFDAEPALTYMLVSVMGAPLLNVPVYYLLLKYALYITYLLSVYLIIVNYTHSRKAAYLALTLFSITPPLSLTEIVAQGVSIILALMTLAILPRIKGSINKAVLLGVLSFIGVVFHATYILVMIAFLIPILLRNNILPQSTLKDSLVIPTLVGLGYWALTYAGIAVFEGLPSSITNFINLILGLERPYSTAWTPWYSLGTQQFLISWALVPAAGAAMLTYSIIKKTINYLKRNQDTKLNYIELMGLLGIVGTVINFFARQSTWLGGRYFYWLYLLILIYVAYHTATKMKRNIAIIAVIMTVISIIGLYAIQDPTHSANTFTLGIGWANNYSWQATEIIAQALPTNTALISDPRIGTPLFLYSFTYNINITGPQKGQPYLIAIGLDKIGQEIFTPNSSANIAFKFSRTYEVIYEP